MLQLADKWIKMRGEEEEKSRPLELVIFKRHSSYLSFVSRKRMFSNFSQVITQIHDKTELIYIWRVWCGICCFLYGVLGIGDGVFDIRGAIVFNYNFFVTIMSYAIDS